MATLESARQKWEAKTPGSAAKWKANSGNGSAFSEGVTRFLGTPPSAGVVSRYQSGVGRVSEQDFAASISGKGQKWAENTRRGLTGP
jgi:hypothetical protein